RREALLDTASNDGNGEAYASNRCGGAKTGRGPAAAALKLQGLRFPCGWYCCCCCL
ncbi:hypothetical protein BDZ97DRAFT_1852109, partial [Flammula alnicola]